jgi:uncharacterized protein DUF397
MEKAINIKDETSSWRKSSYSASNGGCVELCWPESTAVAVRDSKQQDGPTLAFSSSRWLAFLENQVVALGE